MVIFGLLVMSPSPSLVGRIAKPHSKFFSPYSCPDNVTPRQERQNLVMVETVGSLPSSAVIFLIMSSGATGPPHFSQRTSLLLLLVTALASAGNHRFRCPSRKATWRFKASTPLLGRFRSQAVASRSQSSDINSISTATWSGGSFRKGEMERPAKDPVINRYSFNRSTSQTKKSFVSMAREL